MKKVISIIILCLTCIILTTGCTCTVHTHTESVNTEKNNNASMFIIIQDSKLNSLYKVVYHRDTKVMYTISDGDRNRGTFTMLVNPDGTPLLYDGE